jgi:hypothetical protein
VAPSGCGPGGPDRQVKLKNRLRLAGGKTRTGGVLTPIMAFDRVALVFGVSSGLSQGPYFLGVNLGELGEPVPYISDELSTLPSIARNHSTCKLVSAKLSAGRNIGLPESYFLLLLWLARNTSLQCMRQRQNGSLGSVKAVDCG